MFSSVQSLSHLLLFATPGTAARQASLSITTSRSLLKLMSIEWCHTTISSFVTPFSCLRSFPASGSFQTSKFFASDDQSIRSLGFISPFSEYSGLISFSVDWFDLLAAQRTLKSLLQHHSSKASILLCSAFFIVQLSHPYMNYWKNHSLD